jgi:hypothetical protein
VKRRPSAAVASTRHVPGDVSSEACIQLLLPGTRAPRHRKFENPPTNGGQ